MRVRWILIVLLCAGILWYVGRRSEPDFPDNRVPAFSLPQEDGSILRLADLRGQVVLLNFWATYCYPCAQEMPSLNRLAAHFSGQPFKIIGINEEGGLELAWSRIREYRTRVPINFPLVVDANGAVADAYGTFTLPETYLIDPEGRLVRKVVGAITWDQSSIISEIESLLP